MATPDDDQESVEFKVQVDLETVAWLMELADLHHAPPAKVIAALLRDTREDDRAAEAGKPMPTRGNAPTTSTLN